MSVQDDELLHRVIKPFDMVWNEKGPFLTKGSITIADGMIYALNEQDGALSLIPATPSVQYIDCNHQKHCTDRKMYRKY